MKVLVVGATGAIGNTLLNHCLRRPEITSVVAIARRPVPSSDNEKLSSIIIPDFDALPGPEDATWTQMADADALIWAMGSYTFDEDVNYAYPIAFQSALSKRLARNGNTEKFKWILLGGAFTEPDQTRFLYFLTGQRRTKGLLQTKTLEFADDHADWEAIIIRPGGILFGGDTWTNRVGSALFGEGLTINADVLGACVADLVVKGLGEMEEQGIVTNKELSVRGKKVLEAVGH
ncbi:NADH-flavin reductase [Pyrenophora tritici-repentis]|nr:NADH-flavin reductase [Pyrenophora tritici-repentis]